jgi:hypothetical protein
LPGLLYLPDLSCHLWKKECLDGFRIMGKGPSEAFFTYLFDHLILFFFKGIQAFHHGFLKSKNRPKKKKLKMGKSAQNTSQL